MANTISDKLTYLEGTKSAIKDAIVAKGVAVSDSDTFRSYADKIGQISGGEVFDVTKTGLTFAHCNMHHSQFEKLNWTINPSIADISYLFNNSNLPDSYIDLGSKLDTSVSYLAKESFKQANIHQIAINSGQQFNNPSSMFESTISPNSTLQDIVFNITESYIPFVLFYAGISTTGTITVNIKNGINASLVYFMFGYNGNEICDKIVFNGYNSSTLSLEQFFWAGSTNLTKIPEIDLTAVDNYTFSELITGGEMTSITTFGGITNLKVDLNLQWLPNLNAESVDNILNKANDLTGNPTQTITFNSAVYNTLTEEQKSLATSKNWTLAST